jgi:hypothetical protein
MMQPKQVTLRNGVRGAEILTTSKPTTFSTLTSKLIRVRSWMHIILAVGWGLVAGAWVMVETVYRLIGNLINVYTDTQMILGVYNLYDHLILYRIGLGGATFVLLPLLLWSVVKRPL